MHLEIMKNRPDVNAIIHTHPIYSQVFGALHEDIPPVIDEAAQTMGGAVRVAKYAIPGTQELADNLKQIDSDNADKYEADAKEYISRLKELDNRYREAVSGAADKTIMFGDRFPFRYLADEYGLTYYAAFPGCSAETEASFETVTFLSGKADELGLKTIYVIENSDKRVAQTIVKNTKTKNQEIVTMNSMQSVSNKDIAAGVSYIGIMEDNLLALKKGL